MCKAEIYLYSNEKKELYRILEGNSEKKIYKAVQKEIHYIMSRGIADKSEVNYIYK